MSREMLEVVRDTCLWLPEAEERLSHGSPNFHVRGKSFAIYALNHHGDGRVALWIAASPGAQDQLVRTQPRHFFVPPYVGHRGWIGVDLNQSLAWSTVMTLVREAYEKIAPVTLRMRIGDPPEVLPATRVLRKGDIDPLHAPRAVAVIERLRRVCLSYPETSESRQFGHPVWLAGKKTFAIVRHDAARLTLCFWVGVDLQGLLTSDSRYGVPPYMGHHGWISLDVTAGCDWQEVADLALQSYRHFALKRMLRDQASMASAKAPRTPARSPRPAGTR